MAAAAESEQKGRTTTCSLSAGMKAAAPTAAGRVLASVTSESDLAMPLKGGEEQVGKGEVEALASGPPIPGGVEQVGSGGEAGKDYNRGRE